MLPVCVDYKTDRADNITENWKWLAILNLIINPAAKVWNFVVFNFIWHQIFCNIIQLNSNIYFVSLHVIGDFTKGLVRGQNKKVIWKVSNYLFLLSKEILACKKLRRTRRKWLFLRMSIWFDYYLSAYCRFKIVPKIF